MDEQRMQRLVGAVVLFTITFLGVLLVANNPASSPFRSGGYTIYIDLDRAPGVAVNTPVRKDGVLVGRMTDVAWTDEGVRLEVRIDREDVYIYENDKPQVVPSSIFGDAVVQFVRQPPKPRPPGGAQSGRTSASEQLSSTVPLGVLAQMMPQDQAQGLPGQRSDRVPILAGSVIEGEALDDPLTAIVKLNQNLSPSIEKLGEAGEKVAQLADKINQALGDDISGTRVAKVLDELTVTLQDFRRTTNNFDQLIGDDQIRGQLNEALQEFPALMTDARGTLQQAGQTLENFDQVIAGAERNLQNIEGITQPLGEKGEELADLLISSIDNLDVVMADLSRFAGSLNTGEGLLGRLVRDKKLSDETDILLSNANILIYNLNERVRKDFEPIIRDLRVFMDKIARNPGSFIGGAINPTIRK